MFKFTRIYFIVILSLSIFSIVLPLTSYRNAAYLSIWDIVQISYLILLVAVLGKQTRWAYYMIIGACLVNIPFLFHEDFFELNRAYPSRLQFSFTLFNHLMVGGPHLINVIVKLLKWPLLLYTLLLLSYFTRSARIYYGLVQLNSVKTDV